MHRGVESSERSPSPERGQQWELGNVVGSLPDDGIGIAAIMPNSFGTWARICCKSDQLNS